MDRHHHSRVADGAHLPTYRATAGRRRDRCGPAAGALTDTRALMGLIAINVGKDLGLLNDKLFTMFIIMCLLTTATTGPMLRAWLPADLKKLVPH
ncbi:MAG: hypothetical protein IPK22_24420 [Verrucomicrobiaceae bacterium]|nr:hypothetical protein [Verrucomicrobiaceae bacterium]